MKQRKKKQVKIHDLITKNEMCARNKTQFSFISCIFVTRICQKQILESVGSKLDRLNAEWLI